MKEEKSDIIPSNLPGVKKKSFSMFFGGGEIWFEHLDGIYNYYDIVISKFENDYEKFNKPSSPSLIAINLDETIINENIVCTISNKLINGNKKLSRVVFVGLDKKSKKMFSKTLKNHINFALEFINDYEKAKEWLVTEIY